MILRSTDIKSALRSRQKGFLLAPGRFGAGTPPPPVDAPIWEPYDTDPDITLSGSNLVATRNASGSYRNSRASTLLIGKQYWEVAIDGGSLTPNNIHIGIEDGRIVTNQPAGNSASGYVYSCVEACIYNNGSQITAPGTHPASGPGDTVMIAFDASSGKLWLGKNGTWFNSGNPAADTGQLVTASVNISCMQPIVSMYTSGNKIVANFGATAFAYAAPTGFTAPVLNQFFGRRELSTGYIQATASKRTNTMTSSFVWNKIVANLPIKATETKYWEIKLTDVQVNSYFMIGVMEAATATGGYFSSGATQNGGFSVYDGGLYRNGGYSGGAGINAVTNNDIVQLMFEGSTGKIWVGLNNTWNGNPSARTGEAYTFTGLQYPALAMYKVSSVIDSNFLTSQLVYTPPSGATAWS